MRWISNIVHNSLDKDSFLANVFFQFSLIFFFFKFIVLFNLDYFILWLLITFHL